MKKITLSIFLLLLFTVQASAFVRDVKDGEVFYEIKCHVSNDKGEIEQETLRNASVYKFKKDGSYDRLLCIDNHVSVEVKKYK